jgi:dipeptidyl aminopeptidase/acylaminoacyl peptidase
MHWLAVLAVALLVLPAPARAAPAADLAAALAMPRASGLVGAEGAPRFAWIVSEAGVETIWTGGPGEPARAVWSHGKDDGIELSELVLSKDGRQLAFVRGGDAEWADSTLPNASALAAAPKQEVLLLDLAGGGPKFLGEGHSPLFASDGSVIFTQRESIMQARAGEAARSIAQLSGRPGNLRLSPDGKRLLFVEDRDDRAFAGLIDLDANTGVDRVRYLAPGLSFAHDPVFSPDGREVALIRYREPPAREHLMARTADESPYWSIEVADVATGRARTAWQPPVGTGGRYAGTRQHNLHWTQDGRLLFPWERDGWLHVYEIPASGGRPRELTPGQFEVETFLLDADSRSLLFVANAEDSHRHQLWRAAPGEAPRRVTGYTGIESYPALADRAVAFIATDVSRPAHIRLATGETLGPSQVLAGSIEPRAVTITAADGIAVHAQIFEGRGAGPRPAVIYAHGGPRRQMLTGYHPSGYYSNAYAMNQYLAVQGFTVLSVNYRSGTGYGLAFRDARETGREGAAEYRDILAAGQWLAKQPGIDPRRIGIWGGSWGGYLAALALGRNSELFAAGVDFHGVHDMLREPDDGLSPSEQAAARQRQWDSSPLGALNTWRSPVLLVHGDDDRNVDFSQSVLLARELAAKGVPFEELVFPNERHTFLRHENWVTALRASADFLERRLGTAK